MRTITSKALFGLLAACLISLPACKDEAKGKGGEPTNTSPSPDKKPAETSPEANEPVAEEEVAPVPEPIADAEIQKVVDAWLAAQNDGDFEAYKTSYANKFFGIKRIGPKIFKYDQQGWLKDRQRMFKKKMVVEAKDIAIQATANSAVVKFTQTWASGSFKDVGAKQLVIARQGDALKISREEMLDSTVGGAKTVAMRLPATSVGMYRETAQHALLVIQPRVPGDMGKGAAKHITRGRESYKDADLSKVADEHKALIGKTISFEGITGENCSGKVTGLAVYADATPHFGNIQLWDGEWEDDDPRLSDAQVAEELYGVAEGEGTHLVAVTDASRETCKGSYWGHEKGSKFTSYTFEHGLEGELEKKTLAALRALPGYKSQQKSFEGYGKKGFWDASEHNHSRYYAIKGDDKTYVMAHAAAGDGCGDFYGEFWGIWEVKNGSLILLSDPKQTPTIAAPQVAADVDGDGQVEFITKDQVLRLVGPVYKITQDITAPYFDCPC